jgi:hypothetical protein
MQVHIVPCSSNLASCRRGLNEPLADANCVFCDGKDADPVDRSGFEMFASRRHLTGSQHWDRN